MKVKFPGSRVSLTKKMMNVKVADKTDKQLFSKLKCRAFIKPLILPVVILMVMSAAAYIFLQRSVFFPRSITCRIEVIRLPFQTFMWYILFFSILRCYYINQFLFLCFIKSKQLYIDVEHQMRTQLAELEIGYFSLRQLKSITVKLEKFYAIRFNGLWRCWHVDSKQSSSEENYDILNGAYISDTDETTASLKELGEMMSNIKSKLYRDNYKSKKSFKLLCEDVCKHDWQVQKMIHNLEDDLPDYSSYETTKTKLYKNTYKIKEDINNNGKNFKYLAKNTNYKLKLVDSSDNDKNRSSLNKEIGYVNGEKLRKNKCIFECPVNETENTLRKDKVDCNIIKQKMSLMECESEQLGNSLSNDSCYTHSASYMEEYDEILLSSCDLDSTSELSRTSIT